MSLLGVHLTLLIGPTVPLPANPLLADCLEEAKVTHQDSGRSGFQITFRTGRGGPLAGIDYPLAVDPQLKTMNRVILMATFGVIPQVLMDGIITNKELQPGERPGEAKVTITGEDVSVLMDMDEKSAEHPAQPEVIVAAKLIASYPHFGMTPMVVPPPSFDPPIPIERTPSQQGTDLDHLEQMAGRLRLRLLRHAGAAARDERRVLGAAGAHRLLQRAITVNMGAETNATLGAFQTNALQPTTVTGSVQDTRTNQTHPGDRRSPRCACRSPRSRCGSSTSRTCAQTAARPVGHQRDHQAFAQAQGTVDATADAVTVDGELDAARYGGVLEARALVGVRGAGYQHDGLWYVKKVDARSQAGRVQADVLARRARAIGSTVPVVLP